MKKILLTIPFLFCAISCEDDVVQNNENNSDQSICDSQLDQNNITNSLNTIPSCISQIEQGETMEIINYFVEFNNGDPTQLFSTQEIENWASDLATIVTDNIINTPINSNGNWIGNDYYFNFDQNTGSYSWNSTNESYDVSPSDIIEINFPSSPNEISNNATFRMFDYIDYNWQDPTGNNDIEMVGVPTTMTCELVVDNQVILTINHSISFNDSFIVDDYEIPSSINVNVFMDPININLQANRTNPYLFNAQFSIASQSCNINISAETTLLTTNYLDILTTDFADDGCPEVEYFSLDISVGNLILDGIMDCQLLGAALNNDNVTVDEANNTIDFQVFYQGDNVGYLNIVDNNYDEGDAEDIEIIYCDDTKQSIVFYINPLMNSIENILFPYTGLWWNNLNEGDIFNNLN